MAVYAVVQLESIVLEEQRIQGADDDYVLSIVDFMVQHPDGRWCSGCVATIRHLFRGANGGAVAVSIDACEQCAPYATTFERFVEEYYREQVTVDGTEIRIGGRDGSPLLLGARRAIPVTAMVRIGG